MNEPMLKTDPAAISSADFFKRSRARLGFDVPPGLIDPNIIPRSGDHGTDRMLEIIAREQPVRPAAVHSFVLPPEKTAFELTGDESAPPAISINSETQPMPLIRGSSHSSK